MGWVEPLPTDPTRNTQPVEGVCMSDATFSDSPTIPQFPVGSEVYLHTSACPRCGQDTTEIIAKLPTMAEIAASVAAKHGVTVDDIRGDSRKAPICRARFEFFWTARQVKLSDGAFRFSYPQLGRWAGGRDHTTAMHGFSKHEAHLAEVAHG